MTCTLLGYVDVQIKSVVVTRYTVANDPITVGYGKNRFIVVRVWVSSYELSDFLHQIAVVTSVIQVPNPLAACTIDDMTFSNAINHHLGFVSKVVEHDSRPLKAWIEETIHGRNVFSIGEKRRSCSVSGSKSVSGSLLVPTSQWGPGSASGTSSNPYSGSGVG